MTDRRKGNRVRPTVLLALLGSTLTLAACETQQVVSEAHQPTGDAHPSSFGAEDVQGRLLVEPTTAQPTEKLALTFPGDPMRGLAYTLSLRSDDSWKRLYFLTSDGGGLGEWKPGWWSVDDAEGRGWPNVGIHGPGPDHVVVPVTAPAGKYRVCSANVPTRDSLCGYFLVEEP